MLNSWVMAAMLTVCCRSLFPTKKKVLQGALAVTSSKYDEAYQFSGVATVNALQIHDERNAAWVATLSLRSFLTLAIDVYLRAQHTLTVSPSRPQSVES